MNETSSASRVAGKVFRTFSYQKKTYLLSQPLRLSSYADEEALVLWKRIDPGDFGMRMLSRLPANYHAAVWEGCARAAMAGIPSAEEWAAYNASTWKSAYMLWQTLDGKHKMDSETKEPIDLITGVKWALEFITSLPDPKRQELFLKVYIVSQDGEIKNSPGQPANTELAPEETSDQDTTDGQPSMNTSETDTATPPSK